MACEAAAKGILVRHSLSPLGTMMVPKRHRDSLKGLHGTRGVKRKAAKEIREGLQTICEGMTLATAAELTFTWLSIAISARARWIAASTESVFRRFG